MYSPSIEQLITAFKRFPTVGQRTAERFVFSLLKSGKKDVAELTLALKQLIDSVKSCEVCWDFSDQSPCPICTDDKRQADVICVVAESQDVQAMERIGEYRGRYHVLRGTIQADNPKSLGWTKSAALLERIERYPTAEVILALNPNLDGETTMLFLQRKIKEQSPNVTVSRLARGLPMGSDLRYADEITLQAALTNRKSQ